jgi:hypothetical protein
MHIKQEYGNYIFLKNAKSYLWQYIKYSWSLSACDSNSSVGAEAVLNAFN